MAKEKDPNSELLLEARRTTHAVRALARFVLLIVTYQVFAAIAIALGLGIGSGGGEGGAIFFLVIGILLSVIGLIHALVAGHSELELSDRSTYLPSPSAATVDGEILRDENGLLEGTCSCTNWERAGATDVKDGVKYCTRCERIIPA